jgi:hypothetical protein
MLTSNCVINKSENKTRKHWLFSTFFILVFHPLVDLAISAILPHDSLPEKDLADRPVQVIIGMIQAVFLWHCAYRNHGTKLLSFYLVSLPLVFIISMLIPDSGDTGATGASDFCHAYTIVSGLLALTVFFWWLVLSLKMKNVNKAMQKRILTESSKLAE